MEREVLILTALQHEASVIARALKRAGGTADDRRLPAFRLHVIGPGAANLARVERCQACGIVMAGLAGALAPDLQAGEIVIDELSDCCGELDLPWRKGTFHSARQIVSTPREKQELYRATGALVVEMENDAARRLAAGWSVPYIGIRVVLDRADEVLDPALLRLTDSAGRVRPRRLIGELSRRPALLATMLQMRSRSAIALANLSSAVVELTRSCVAGWTEHDSSASAPRPNPNPTATAPGSAPAPP
jgi:hypothetical protein